MRYLYFNLILILGFSSISLTAQVDKDVAKVQQILQRQATDWNKGDLEAFMNGILAIAGIDLHRL